MKRITMLMMAGAMLIGTVATAQPSRQSRSEERRTEQRDERNARHAVREESRDERRAESQYDRQMREAGRDARRIEEGRPLPGERRAEYQYDRQMREAGRDVRRIEEGRPLPGERRADDRMRHDMRHDMRQMNRGNHKQCNNNGGVCASAVGNCCGSVMVFSCESAMAGDMVNVNFLINYDGVMLNPNEQLVITPYIYEAGQLRYLPPVVLLGQRSFKSVERGNDIIGNISGMMPYETVVMSRQYVRQMRRDMRNNDMSWAVNSPNTVMYSASFPFESWMDGADIMLMHVFSTTKNEIMSYNTHIGSLYNPVPPQVMFIVPEIERVKARSEQMTARVVFLVNKASLDPNIFNNTVELENMYKFTDRLVKDKNIKITGVTLTGYASPEGPYAHNADLAQRRVNTIRDLIQQKYPSIDRSVYKVKSVPEDWDSVRNWVAASDIRFRNQVLGIIEDFDPDKRDAKIRALDNGTTYNMLLHDVYPGLRRTVYTVDYTVVPFTVDEGKRVLATNPNYLSLNELYQIALSYPQDSPQYEDVFAVAVQYYPNDPVANNNMAAIALRKNDLAAARRYLERTGGHPGAANNYGVLKALEGDYDAAEAYFAQAAQNGSKEAQFNLANLTSLRRK